MVKLDVQGFLALWCFSMAKSLPRVLHISLGRWIGCIFLWAPIRQRAVARRNIELCFPEYTKKQVDQTIQSNAAMLGKACFDTAVAWCWSEKEIKRQISYQINGLDLLQSSDGRGTLLLFKHSLHFMLDGRLLALHCNIYSISRDLKKPSIFIEKFTQYRKMICQDFARPNESIKVVRWLKKGHIVSLAIDQDYGLRNSIIINFFNQPAATVVAPYKLHKMTNCRILIADTYYDKSGKLMIDIEEMTSLDSNCERSFLQALNDATAKQISRNPHEYHWYYKRFKSTKAYQESAASV